MDYQKKSALIGKCEIFKKLSSRQIAMIVDSFALKSFAKGEMIINEGATGEDFYILVEGKVDILKEMAGVCHKLRQISTTGECFGEITFLTQEKRTSSVQAVNNVQCLAVTAADFFRIAEKNQDVSWAMYSFLGDRLKSSEKATGDYLLNAYESLTFSLSDLAESRDPETGAHLSRVRNYCSFLAGRLAEHPWFAEDITPEFIKNIYSTSPLHDIGKVAIPDHILLKPGRLTDEEFETMKIHTWIGANTMLQVMSQCDYPAFGMGYHISHYHHERYDGNGYPAGLAGADIPLEARIMALADVYDALLSRRPYKEPFTYDKTLQIIAEGKGTQFDPDIVDVLMENSDEFAAIHQRFAE